MSQAVNFAVELREEAVAEVREVAHNVTHNIFTGDERLREEISQEVAAIEAATADALERIV